MTALRASFSAERTLAPNDDLDPVRRKMLDRTSEWNVRPPLIASGRVLLGEVPASFCVLYWKRKVRTDGC